MKTLSYIFTFLLLLNSVSYAFAEHCIDESVCATTVDNCHETEPSHDSTEKKSESSHSQCEMHCFHPQSFYNNLKNVEFNPASSLEAFDYSFHINPVFIDGPLRPPLV